MKKAQCDFFERQLQFLQIFLKPLKKSKQKNLIYNFVILYCYTDVIL